MFLGPDRDAAALRMTVLVPRWLLTSSSGPPLAFARLRPRRDRTFWPAVALGVWRCSQCVYRSSRGGARTSLRWIRRGVWVDVGPISTWESDDHGVVADRREALLTGPPRSSSGSIFVSSIILFHQARSRAGPALRVISRYRPPTPMIPRCALAWWLSSARSHWAGRGITRRVMREGTRCRASSFCWRRCLLIATEATGDAVVRDSAGFASSKARHPASWHGWTPVARRRRVEDESSRCRRSIGRFGPPPRRWPIGVPTPHPLLPLYDTRAWRYSTGRYGPVPASSTAARAAFIYALWPIGDSSDVGAFAAPHAVFEPREGTRSL